jgi:hypothetical protein
MNSLFQDAVFGQAFIVGKVIHMFGIIRKNLISKGMYFCNNKSYLQSQLSIRLKLKNFSMPDYVNALFLCNVKNNNKLNVSHSKTVSDVI